jgi:hypothetical protein
MQKDSKAAKVKMGGATRIAAVATTGKHERTQGHGVVVGRDC